MKDIVVASVAFAVVGFLDLICTLILVGQGFIELNPIAALIIHNLGPLHLIWFKVAVTLSVIFVAELASDLAGEPRTGVLWFGTFLTGCVVIYSSYLIMNL